MPSPFVLALRDARSRIGSAADACATAAERVAARRLAHEIDQILARLEGTDGDRDLISVVCHDLKDPLASIVMGAGFLKRTIAPDQGPVRRVVDAIARSADRMNQVVGDFHDLAKLDSGMIEADRRPCDVGSALRAAAAPLEDLARAHDVRFELDVPVAPLVAICDRGRLLQIVSKLVGNAVRFTPPGGRVALSASYASEEVARTSGDGEAEIGRTPLEARDPQRAVVRFSVADTGRGIAADRLATIFDHAANARRTPRDGPGLGLAIVRGLVELQGGAVRVESRIDQGSRFSFTLPAAPVS
ncbi:MAG: HAMP domain-containing sensor histidine kinase [Polyangiaceae bacterium]|jgi:signal transduction histidine kinase